MTDKRALTDPGQWEWQDRQRLEQVCGELGLAEPSNGEKLTDFGSGVRPGQDLVIAGYIGLGGTIWMGRHREEILRKTLPEDYVESGKALQADMDRVSAAAVLNAVVSETDRGNYGAVVVYDVIEGGIFAALWEFAQAAGTGIYARLKDIPVRQQTIEFCEVFDLNPYQLLSGGCTLIAADNGCDLLYRMNRAGIPCAVIGKVTKDHDRVVAHDDTCRYLTRPQRDEIFELL